MPPTLALFLWMLLLLLLLLADPAKEPSTSQALWVPVIWIFIVASQLPSQWFFGSVRMSAQAFEEGNPLDRTIFTVLILMAIGILRSRSFKWGSLFSRNSALMAFLFFTLVSVVWSDFPLVALKRWFRDLGSYLVILVVLSDPRPLAAVRTVLRRLGYSLISLSIMLNKYYPQISKHYDRWTGVGDYAGATTSKNMLGLLCLVIGLFFFWDTVTRWPERKQQRTKRIIVVDLAFLAMTLWLLYTAHSTTSTVCTALGCLVIAGANSKLFQRHPALLKALIPASFCLYLILDLGLGMNGSMAQAVGKDPTLTDRTKIWAFLLSMHTNPLIGTGYQSFWLGSRLEWFWQNSGLGHLNEAHNGYLEVYLELGLIGVSLFLGFLLAAYRTLCRKLTTAPSLAVLGLATWMCLVFYNMSEAAFEGGLLYTLFLMTGIALPERGKNRVRSTVTLGGTKSTKYLPTLPLEATSVRTAR